MVNVGNFFFHYRNYLFPFFYALLFVPSPLIFEDYRMALLVGGLVAFSGQFVRGFTIGFVYIIRGGKNRQVYAEKLITEGLFNHCRNPMYVGNVLMLIGTGILANSLVFLLIVGPFFIFVYQAIIAAEENFLRNKFGEQFDDYTKRVNRWLISFSGLGTTLSGMTYKWKKVILKEYNTTYIWLLGCILLTMKQMYEHQPELFSEYRYPFYMLIGLVTFLYLFLKVLKKRKILTAD